MKYIKIILSHLLVAFLVTGSIAQNKQSSETKHSHPDYERSIKELRDSLKKTDKTYEQAQETYAFAKGLFEQKKELDENVIRWILYLIYFFMTVGVVSQGYNFYTNNKLVRDQKDAHDKIIKDAKEKTETIKEEALKQHSIEIKKIVAAEEKTIIELISSKERDYYLRKNAKIIVINHEDTGIGEGFKKVLGLFEKFDFDIDTTYLKKLSDSLSIESITKFRDADLVIIENLDQYRQWEIGAPRSKTDLSDIDALLSDVNKDTEEKLKDNPQNQALIINLINKICDSTALVYYGPGILLSNLADKDKQHLIAFAQSPSTLFSNVMNLLRFKDILENQK